MKLNYFKAAEQDIMSLPVLRKSLVFLDRKRQRLINKGAPSEIGAIDHTKPYSSSSFVNDALNEILGLSEISQEITDTEEEIQHIEAVLAELLDEQRKVLTMFYINNLPAERIAEAIFVESDKTVYNIRNKALMQYAVLSYGARAKTADGKR